MPLSQNVGFRETAFQVLQGLPDYRQLSFLELGCGDAWILEQLHAQGVQSKRGTTFRPRSQDYIRGREHPAHLHVDPGIDLNQPLPYADASFDVVYSTEVIEHVEGHRNFLLEAARVLKPGGWLVLTTPNLHRLISRLNFAFSGIHLNKRGLIPWTCTAAQMEEYHHHCVDFPLLHWLLWGRGVRIQELRSTQIFLASTLLMVLLWPLISVLTRRNVLRQAAGTPEDSQARQDLLRWLNSPPLLRSEHICLKAQKLGPVEPGTPHYERPCCRISW